MRLFAAIPLPHRLAENLKSCIKPIAGIRWVPSSQYHITLHFYGEATGAQQYRLSGALRQVQQSSFEITLSGLGTFPPYAAPQVLWAGIESPGPLMELYKSIEKVSAAAGWGKDQHDYIPHVTLGRVKGDPLPEIDQFIDRYSDWGRETFIADRFVLYDSDLTGGKTRYRPLYTYRLDG